MSEKLDLGDFSIEVSERIAARTQDPNLIAANARIRALERDRDAFAKHAKLVEHKVITCGVAARHPDANLSRTGAYGSTWNSPQAEEVRKLRDERDALRRELESASQAGGGEAREPIGYMNARAVSILEQGSVMCTHVSPAKTEFQQVAIYKEPV